MLWGPVHQRKLAGRNLVTYQDLWLSCLCDRSRSRQDLLDSFDTRFLDVLLEFVPQILQSIRNT
jgi:hypothetical protein